MIFWARAATVAALLPCFQWLVSAPSSARLMTVIALLAILLALQTAPVITMLPELFPKAVRTTGMSVVYGLGISVFGGFAQFFVTWLLRHPQSDGAGLVLDGHRDAFHRGAVLDPGPHRA